MANRFQAFLGDIAAVAANLPRQIGLLLVDQGDGATYAPATAPLQGQIWRTNAGFAAPGQTVKQYSGKVATSTTAITTVPLETVTAGKILTITDIMISSDSATSAEIQIQAAGSVIFRQLVRDLAPIQLPGIETQPNASAGQAVNLVLPITAGGAQNISFNVYGVEQ